ncbi:diguanylate cyclase [Parafrankia soli]|uniref:Diguanylate cyclase n=2 Tax=Parafrankia TaxID=2994362 RepID=A0A1S1QLN1_9ACTN|nr:GGDEF domain-containing protein [Parafrankia soli]OHV34506.1 diguanylate cyclase [Parafrankia soli]CAI7975431.1 Diguanylate cyclase [Frankia sp. Hr75.2]
MITDDVAAAVLDSLPSRIAVLGPDGMVVRLNDAWRRSAAAGLAVVPVRPGASWLAACEAAGRSTEPLRTLAGLTRRMLDNRRDQVRVEIPLATPRGERWLDVRIRALSRGDGLVVVVDDVTDRHDREAVLRHRATHDPVTGLPNRSALRDLIAEALAAPPTVGSGQMAPPGVTRNSGRRTSSERAGVAGFEAWTVPVRTGRPDPAEPPTADRTAGVEGNEAEATLPGAGAAGVEAEGTGGTAEGTGVAVLFLDLDAFGRVNQRFGYTVGDGTLRAVALRFAEVLGPGAVLGRWGGDEFVVVTTEVTGHAAVALADRLTSCLVDPLVVDDHRVRVTASVGIAFGGGLRSGHGEVAPLGADHAAGLGTPPAPVHRPLDGDALVRMAGEEIVKARSRARETRRGRSRRQNRSKSGDSS